MERVGPGNWTPKGHQQFTTGFNAAQLLTVPAGANLAVIQINANNLAGIRWRDDGTAPTDAIGQRLANATTAAITAGDGTIYATAQLTYCGHLAAFQFIQDAIFGAPDTVDVAYYEIR